MPVLPEVESRMVLPLRSFPVCMPSCTMQRAGRSFTEPPGLKPSSLAKILTPVLIPSVILEISSSGVLPIRSRTDSTFLGSLKHDGMSLKLDVAVRFMGSRSYDRTSGDGGNDRYIVSFF